MEKKEENSYDQDDPIEKSDDPKESLKKNNKYYWIIVSIGNACMGSLR